MKTTITFFAVFFIFSTLANAQCFREDSLEAIDDPDQYPVSGTAMLVFDIDGTKQVVFGEDFETVQGIELRVFLSTTPRINQGGTDLEVTTEPLQDDNGGQDTGDPITGSKSFDVPEDVNLSDFDYIIIQCVQADVLWGRAELGPNSGADCDTLDVSENLVEQLSIYPNPATDNFKLSGLSSKAEITIFDALGKKVLSKGTLANETIDISSLNSGLYLLRVASNGQNATQKLIIQ